MYVGVRLTTTIIHSTAMSVLHLVIRKCMEEHRDKVLETLVTYQIYLPELLSTLHDLLFYAFRNRNETLRTEVTRLNDYFQIISPRMVTLIRDDPHKAHEIMSKVRQVFKTQTITTASLQEQIEKGWTPAFLCLCCIVFGEGAGEAASWSPIVDRCTPKFQAQVPSICTYFRRPCPESLKVKAADVRWRSVALMLGDEQPWETLMGFVEDDVVDQYTRSVAVDSASDSSSSASDTNDGSSPLDSHSSVSLEV